MEQTKLTDFPNEDLSDSMTTIHYSRQKLVWRPNNYRRKLEVKQREKTSIRNLPPASSVSYGKHNKLLSIKNYAPNITLQYGKTTLTAIYSQNIIGGVKEHYLIERDTIEEIEEAIDKKKEEIEKKLDKALYEFARKYKITLHLKKPIWDRYEDFIKGEDYIDRIPKEVIVHDTYFKKVYGKGIEFKNTGEGEAPTVHLKNYIKNRSIEDISPLIAKEINAFHNTTAKNLSEFSEQIRLHLSVLNNINKSFKKFNQLLEQKKIDHY